MKKTSFFEEISIFGLIFEIIIISSVFFFLAYISNSADPFFIKSEINIILILVAVITLFYGLVAGIILIALIGTGLYYFYKPFPLNYFMNITLFMLIFAEFHFYWNRTAKKLKKQLEYFEGKLQELVKVFYLLKLSHDQLEKSYILKPVSLRNTLNHIKQLYNQSPFKAYEEVLSVISKNYGIKSAAIFSYNDGKFLKEFVINFEEDLNEESEVLNKAIEIESVSYLPKFEDLRNDYLAVIPAYDSSENLRFILVIKEMQFLNYTQDTLFSVWVILNYLADYMSHIDFAKDLIETHPACPSDVIVEIKRLSFMRKKLDLKSYAILINIKDSPTSVEDISQHISKLLRGGDLICNNGDFIVLILPFVSYSNVESVIEKIKFLISDRFYIKQNNISIKVFEILADYKKTIKYLISTTGANEPD